jgi:hypothetical protein
MNIVLPLPPPPEGFMTAKPSGLRSRATFGAPSRLPAPPGLPATTERPSGTTVTVTVAAFVGSALLFATT